VNKLLRPIFKSDCFKSHPNTFNFERVRENYISSAFEGQINTGKMMDTLLYKVRNAGINVLNSITVESFTETADRVFLKTDHFELETRKLFIATNGFAAQLIKEDVKPARAQVLITKPIPNLAIKGTFHLDEEYYYFRNIDNRILFGGGRNLDFKGEETSSFGETQLIQQRLENLLRTVVLPRTLFEIDLRWSGIMGVGAQKRPIVKSLSDRVYCGVRMGGMGIAIGSTVGRDL